MYNVGAPVENASWTQELLFCQTYNTYSCKYFGSINDTIVSVATIPGRPFHPGLSEFTHFAFSKVLYNVAALKNVVKFSIM